MMIGKSDRESGSDGGGEKTPGMGIYLLNIEEGKKEKNKDWEDLHVC